MRKLSDVKGISEAKVLKLKEIVKAMVPMDFKTAADALEDRKWVSCFDNILLFTCLMFFVPSHINFFTICLKGSRNFDNRLGRAR